MLELVGQSTYKQKLDVLEQQQELIEDESEQEEKEAKARREAEEAAREAEEAQAKQQEMEQKEAEKRDQFVPDAKVCLRIEGFHLHGNSWVMVRYIGRRSSCQEIG